ncbi:MAG: AMP-binding protein [Candidatus Eisenbacteria bacterium]|uniref:AMP-binding protein n=1 Tax=Eiseniibacteriota bacterium TaxID=2212470 RepID=A0A849SV36_UNCEI|nr:AMP-binding protein [Candidatus Eisenbacteria bacterium]
MNPHPTASAPPPVVRLLPHLVDFAANHYGDAPFLLRHTPQGWSGLSFNGFARSVHAFAALLESAGIGPGTRVGLQAENRPEWPIAYMAVLEAGAVVVPIDVLLQPREVGEILETAGATHVITSARQRDELQAIRDTRLPALELISLDPRDGDPLTLPVALARFATATARTSPAEPGDLAVLIFTSGTTGQAKGVMLSHSNLLHNVEAVARTFVFGPGDRFLSVLPLHHTFESTGGMLCPMRVGASVAYARGLKSNELREDIRSSGTTLFIGVPLLYEKLLAGIHRAIDDAPLPRRLLARTLLGVTRLVRLTTGARIGWKLLAPLREKAGLGKLRMYVSGASPLPTEVFWGFADFGWPLLEGYGLTETSPVVVANRPPRPLPGAVGWPLPGIELRIVNPDESGDGEIAVRGPNVMIGYYRQPEMTAEVLRDGWFFTGDLGHLTADGRLKITGRLKNMIATAAGKKIYPEEVEAVLANCPYILEVVVAGGRDARGDREEVHAYIHPDRQALEGLARLQNRVCDDAFIDAVLKREVDARGQELAAYKRVKRLYLRHDEFPKTTTGKIKRPGLTADAPGTRVIATVTAVA